MVLVNVVVRQVGTKEPEFEFLGDALFASQLLELTSGRNDPSTSRRLSSAFFLPLAKARAMSQKTQHRLRDSVFFKQHSKLSTPKAVGRKPGPHRYSYGLGLGFGIIDIIQT